MTKEDVSKIFEGATDEQINAVLDLNSGEIAAVERKITAERDNYKSQFETAQTALKEFEGIDVGELNGKIEKLTADLKEQEASYQAKIADIEFDAVLDKALTGAGAKNNTAVKALLDIDALKVSKNQAEDIKKAVAAVKTENDYLFGESKPYVPIGGGVNVPEGKMTLSQAMEYANTHPGVDVNTLF